MIDQIFLRIKRQRVEIGRKLWTALNPGKRTANQVNDTATGGQSVIPRRKQAPFSEPGIHPFQPGGDRLIPGRHERIGVRAAVDECVHLHLVRQEQTPIPVGKLCER